MSRTDLKVRPASSRVLLVAMAAIVGLGAAACGPAASATTPPRSPSAAPGSFAPGGPDLASPIDGLLTGLQSEGLTKVTGFQLRTDAGAVVPFRLGILENGAQFPPGHLAEHMTTTTRVRVYFRDEGGEHVVYRLEDAP